MSRAWLKSKAHDALASAGVTTIPEEIQHANWSGSFSDAGAHKRFVEGILANLVLPGEVTAMACEPVMGYLAVGTAAGTIHLFGAPPVQLSITLRPAVKVKILLFKSGSPLLVCIGECGSSITLSETASLTGHRPLHRCQGDDQRI